MNRRTKTTVVAVAALTAVSTGAWTSSAGAAVSQPVSGGGYYVSGPINEGTVSFVVPSPICGANENSALYTGLQSAAVDPTYSTFASGVLSVCVAGVPGTLAIQYFNNDGTPVPGVQPGDKVRITFSHTRGIGEETLTDSTSGVSGTTVIPFVTNQAGVFFGVHPAQDTIPMLDGGKVTLNVTVDRASLGSASPVKQTKRVAGISLTPTTLSATGRLFTVREAAHTA